MHGIKRVRQSSQALEAKRLREKAKLDDYLALTQDVLSRKKHNDWSTEALQLTSLLLLVNPEFYTVWNYRRRILLDGVFPRSSPKEINTLITDDLSSTMIALKAHPKIYWIWNHRRWCLENTPLGPGADHEVDTGLWRKLNWDRELYVVEKMLDADPRNFHAWNYRRYVLSSMPVPRTEKSELVYTSRKIEANISNFSAWHQRSKVWISLQESSGGALTKSKEEEFDLLRNAMYTDPNDQSVWMYHRWLMGTGKSTRLFCCMDVRMTIAKTGDDRALLESEIEAIQELLDEQPDSKWCMESIVHYKRLLLKKYSNEVDVKKLSADCKRLLRQLELVDPARCRRYQDLGHDLPN